VGFPAFSSAVDASRGRCVSTTDAAIVSGASVVSSSSGILSSCAGVLERDMIGEQLIKWRLTLINIYRVEDYRDINTPSKVRKEKSLSKVVVQGKSE
jgi:hypothetical protein